MLLLLMNITFYGMLTIQDVYVDRIWIGMRWHTRVFARIGNFGLLYEQIRCGHFTFLGNHRHTATWRIIIYFLVIRVARASAVRAGRVDEKRAFERGWIKENMSFFCDFLCGTCVKIWKCEKEGGGREICGERERQRVNERERERQRRAFV